MGTALEPAPFHVPAADIPLVMVEGRVPGAPPLRVLFDTGDATPYVIVVGARSPAARLARPAGEPPYITHATAGGHAARFTPARLLALTVGGVALTDVTTGVSPAIDLVSHRLPGGLDAVVGQVFAMSRVVRIDYPARQVDFAAAPGPAAEALPMTLAPGRPLSVFGVTINGQGPFRMALDTGAGLTLLSPAAARRAHVSASGPELNLGGAGGNDSTGHETRAAIDLGPRHWPAARVAVTDLFGPISAEAGIPVDGVLGADLFAGVRLTIDYPGRRLWVQSP